MIEDFFQEIFDSPPEVTVRAPGRVNLIGEHTDYNDGFVLPAAIDRAVWFTGRRRRDRLVRIHSQDFHDRVEFDLDHNEKDGAHTWSNYFRGVSKFLETQDRRLTGADIAFGGDVPREAGLSSSAAVEVASVAFWQRLLRLDLAPLEAVRLALKAENDFVGVPCGIMDQFISALGRRNHALFLDCRDLSYRHVPWQEDVRLVVCNSGVRRALTQSEYPVRREQCRQAVAMIAKSGKKTSSLRDVCAQELEAARERLGPVLYRRARHVITENQRVFDAVAALERGDMLQFGTLMNQSHESLRADYEVSCKELDTLVELAVQQPGALGARMTGAGFGGCTVNLVRADAAASFAQAVAEGYRGRFGLRIECYICQTSDGALAPAL